MAYRNHEGYPDPTAGQAYANIRREERMREKAERQAKIDALMREAGIKQPVRAEKEGQRYHPPRYRRSNDGKEARAWDTRRN